MKKFTAVFVSLCLALTCAAYADSGFSENIESGKVVTYDAAAYENGNVFVMYADGTFDVINCETEEDIEKTLSELSGDESVLLVQPDYTYESADVSDELFKKQWALLNDGSFSMREKRNEYPVFDEPFGEEWLPWTWVAPDWFGRGFRGFSYGQNTEPVSAKAGVDVNVSKAWELYNGGTRDVIVALVDTGVDLSHEDLEGIFWTNDGEISGNGIDDDENGYTDDVNGWNFYSNNNIVYVGEEDSHGTHGAGTIAATADNGKGIAGIVQSERVKIMPLKALGGNDGSGSTSSIIRAILYAEKNGASICNLSLGTTKNDKALYEVMKNSNMLFVVAAGNDGCDNDKSPTYPASYDLDNIISVANIGYDGTLANSSNYGSSSVDIAAPGTYILSTTADNTYSYMTGTSMSAPMVTAAAAMIYSHYSSVSLADVKEIILSSSRKLDSLNGYVLCGGMLDIGAAFEYDLTSLTNGGWEEKTPVEYKGSAPEISVYSSYYAGKSYIVASFYDEDGDISKTAYAEGERDESYFKTSGTEFETDSSGKAAFEATEGVYTFYACDICGNESVYTVRVVSRGEKTDKNRPKENYGSPQEFFGFPNFYDSGDAIGRFINNLLDFFMH